MDEQAKAQHISTVLNSQFYTEDTATCQSQLAAHRVIPYHWKGMNQDQRKDILQKQEGQRYEADQIKKYKEDEEMMYAKQAEVRILAFQW